jgi:hypothetical protein
VGGHGLGVVHPRECAALTGTGTGEAGERLRPQSGRVRIEPKYDAAAALFDERRKPVAEMASRTPGQGRDFGMSRTKT